jgi:hypothetical protein
MTKLLIMRHVPPKHPEDGILLFVTSLFFTMKGC